MPPTPSQIREQLLKAIDQDAKVTNMVGVLEAITCLENIQITKEALEETRLGKIVNDIRKNTEDSALSLRCKKLVRIWSKQFVRGTPSSSKPAGSSTQDATTNRQPTPPSQGTTSIASTGGNRTPSLKTQTTTTPTSTSAVDKKKSENRKRRKPSTSPSIATSTGSAPASAKKPRPATSTPTSNATKDQTNLETKNGMPAQRDTSKSNLQSSKSAFAKVKPESKVASRTSSPALKAKVTSSPGLSKLNANTSKALSKSPLLTKQVSSPVNSRGNKSSPSVKVKQPSSSNSRDSSRFEAGATLHVSAKADDTVRDKLVSSKPQGKSPSVQKSLEDSNSSSATVKLRSPKAFQEKWCITPSRPQPASPSPDTIVSQEQDRSKTFSIFDDDYDEQDDILSTDKDLDKASVDFEKAPLQSSLRTVDCSESPETSPLDVNPVEPDLEIDKNLLEAIPNQDAVLSDSGEEPAPSKPVTKEDLVRISEQQWDGVNGCYANRGEWFDWTQALSVSTQDDALHILPYICID